ncbi:MAG: alpha/beta hydrolase [Planctomycetota bacterium]
MHKTRTVRCNRQALLAISVYVAISMTLGRSVYSMEPTDSDVCYGQVGDVRLLLDVYESAPPADHDADAPFPAGPLRPLVVWIHGGAWRSGSKSRVPVLPWLQHGFMIASVDYRLSPVARFPAQIHDIKAAIRFMVSQREHFRINPDQIVVAGASAGGHLAALVGTTNGHAALEWDREGSPAEPANVRAIVSFYGAANLLSILSQSTEHGLSVRVPALRLLLGTLPAETPGIARLASPVSHVDAHDPPLWLIHGDADPQMPPEQSHELMRAYQDHGLPASLDIIEGGLHGGREFYSVERLNRIAGQLLRYMSNR